MMLLSTLYNKFFGKKEPAKTDHAPSLRASILIGVDHQQQYFFDIKWDYEDIDKTANDLANIVLGLTYSLFTSQIKNLLLEHAANPDPHDEFVLNRTIQLIQEKSQTLNSLLDDNSPIIKPSEVFRPVQDVNKTN